MRWEWYFEWLNGDQMGMEDQSKLAATETALSMSKKNVTSQHVGRQQALNFDPCPTFPVYDGLCKLCDSLFGNMPNIWYCVVHR